VPPESELGFQIVRGLGRPVSMSRRWWGLSPAWGLAAAALVVGAVSAAIANVEVTAATNGITVRTGWSRTAGATPAATGAAAATAADVQRVDARVRELEAKLAAASTTTPVPASMTSTPAVTLNSGMSDAELLRVVRRLIDESEARQEGELARRILQVNRDFEVTRRADLDRVGRGMEEIRSTSYEAFRKSKSMEDLYVRVASQQR
jgi:hypothetical protein